MANATRQTQTESGGDKQIGLTKRESLREAVGNTTTEATQTGSRSAAESRTGEGLTTDTGSQTRQQTGSQDATTAREGSETSEQTQRSEDQSVREHPQVVRRSTATGGGTSQSEDIGFKLSFTWKVTG